jgi:allantoicase
MAIQQDANAPEFTRKYLNLADSRLGAKAIFCSDQFFGPLERMLNPEPAVFIPGKYDDNGKWMDGWETRRKRSVGEDWSIIQLARPGNIVGFDIDTSHFTGNYAPAVSIKACYTDDPTGSQNEWIELLTPQNLSPNNHHYFEITSTTKVNHLKVTIFPDGGIARLRVYGTAEIDWSEVKQSEEIDFAAAENGARIVAVNNQHFGLASNLLMPGRGQNMGDGWETRRRREPGNDWCVIHLAQPATIDRIEVDTCHFKGNYPDRFSLQANFVQVGTDTSLITQCMFWPTLVAEQKLEMHKQHYYSEEIQPLGKVSHVRLNIFPDGGVSRLRLWGKFN